MKQAASIWCWWSALVAACFLCAVAAGSNVVDLTPDTFDSVVGQDKPAFVEFFAPWCGHCKKLAPDYEIVGDSFAKSPVVVAKVDADQHRSLGTRFGVTGFPTLKWFPAGSLEPEVYSGGRTPEDIADFINQKTGLNVRIKSAPSPVAVLTPDNFDSIVLDSNKDVLVEFYAPWCGHCKKLEPDYNQVGATFTNEPNCIVAKVDADKHKSLATRFGVSGYPTIKFFPKNNKAGEDYNQGRSPDDFVGFLNDRCGSQRQLGGMLNDMAGRLPDFDNLAEQFKQSIGDQGKLKELHQQATDQAQSLIEESAAHAKLYLHTMKKVLEKGSDFVSSEISRLERLISSGNVKADKVDLFTKRINILRQFE